MIRKSFYLLASLAALAMPAGAAAPPFETPASVAYMIDLSSGATLYAKDADRRIPPASMAKMMATHVAFDLIERGELSPDKICTVRPETWRRWHGPAAGSTMFLSAGEQVSVRNLLHGIVTLSGNDATVALAECISGTEPAFVALMNRQSRALGLANSRWGNPVGWPDGGATYTTARDLATLAAATIRDHPRLYREYYGMREFTWGRTLGANAPITQGNRNPLLGRVAGADGLKTGHTEEAGFGFTGSADQNGRRIVMVVAGLTSFNQRIEESVRFMEWGFNAWQSRPLLRQGQRIGEARVQLGGSSTVGLVAPRNIAVTYPAGLGQNLRARIVYQGPVKAPITQGQHIADLVVETADMPAQTMPLVAESAVGEAGFFGRLWYGLKSFRRHGVTGRFITLEGGEGVGKSTQIESARGGVARARPRRGRDPRARRQPRRRGDPRAAAARRRGTLGPETEALLFAAARSDHVARTIRPALDQRASGCSATASSTARSPIRAARAGSGWKPIQALHAIGSGGLLPDRTLLLDLPRSDATFRTCAAIDGQPT